MNVETYGGECVGADGGGCMGGRMEGPTIEGE